MKTKLPTLLFAPPMPTAHPPPRLYNLVLSARPPLRTAAAGLVEPAQLCQPHYIRACHPHPNCPPSCALHSPVCIRMCLTSWLGFLKAFPQ